MGNAGSKEAGASLTKAEIDRIKRRFDRQTGKSGRMSLADFQRIPELSGNFFVGRIFQLSDTDKDGFITVDDFTAAVEMLGKVYSEEEKIRFAFGLYDLDGDDFISESDLLKVLLHTARGSVNPVQLEKTVTTIVQEYDADKDGRLSFPEFKHLAAAEGHKPRPVVG